MPQVTVYIREADLPTWKAIDKKSEFMHRALTGATLVELGTRNGRVEITKETKVPRTTFEKLQQEHDIRYTAPEDAA